MRSRAIAQVQVDEALVGMPTSSEIDLKYVMDSSSSRMVICFLSCEAYGFFFAAEKSYSLRMWHLYG